MGQPEDPETVTEADPSENRVEDIKLSEVKDSSSGSVEGQKFVVTPVTESPDNIKQENNKEKIEDPDFSVTEPTEICGEWGPWQRTIFVLCMMTNFPAAWQNLGYTFFSYPLDYYCTPPSDVAQHVNFTVDRWKSMAFPVEHLLGKSSSSQCRMYEPTNQTVDAWIAALNSGEFNFDPSGSQVVHCSSYQFDHSFFGETIIEKWGLVCENSWLSSMTQSVYMFGFLITVGITGQLGDRFGRRPVMLFCIALLQISSTVIAFSSSYIFYVIMRCIVAIGASGLFTASFVILMEISGPGHRTYLGVMMGFWWAMAYIGLTGMAWLFRSWSSLQLALTLPWYCLVVFWWLMPESPRWLLAQGRLDEARALLEKGADKNLQSTPHVAVTSKAFFKYMEHKIKSESDKNTKRANVLDLVKTPTMRCKTLNLYYCWFVIAFIYYGLSLNSGDLGGDPYVNFAIASAVEIPSMILTYLVLTRLGRRRPLSASLLVGGITCLLTIPIGQDLLWLRITLAMAGKLFITSAFAVVYIVSAEIYPTVVRNVGVGSSSTCARVGSILAPFVKDLGKLVGMSVPLGIFGVLSVVSGSLILLLPETHEKPVPDTIEQGEAIKISTCWPQRKERETIDPEVGKK